jgi:WhiB family transcriptional regulator, redox-sensing transcriptional regulator
MFEARSLVLAAPTVAPRTSRLFFSDDPVDIADAKAMCAQCAVRSRCLAGAIGRREPIGVWGGELIVNGVVVAARPRRGRPRKVELAYRG